MNKCKIVLITSGQPSLNPRLVKEADALTEAGFEVVIIYQFWNSWATEADKQLLTNKQWKAVRVGGSPKDGRLTYMVTRLLHKFWRFLRAQFGLEYYLAELCSSRSFLSLLNESIRQKADLYVGHNPGALSVASIASRKRNAKCGFDAEDYHRNEYTDDENHPDFKTKKFLEEKYFPRYDYLITASPLISEKYSQIFPQLKFNTILNVFPRGLTVRPLLSELSKPVKLFWFSQTVGHNRGLEDIVNAIHLTKSNLIELHILGNPRELVITKINELASKYSFAKSQINFYSPMPPDDIFAFCQNFDVGMATEIGAPFNRDICLTNKIFTYIQSGLAVIASDTSAQKRLILENPAVGLLYPKNDVNTLSRQLETFLKNRQLLNDIKLHNYNLGQTNLNWEEESKQLLKIVAKTIQN